MSYDPFGAMVVALRTASDCWRGFDTALEELRLIKKLLTC